MKTRPLLIEAMYTVDTVEEICSEWSFILYPAL